MKIVAGIDVSKATLDVCVAREVRTFSNVASDRAALASWLGRCHVDLVVMEATNAYHDELACELVERGFEVAVVNPARALYYARSLGKRNKTDKVDARTLLELGAAQADLNLFVPPTAEQRELTQLVRLRQDVVAMASTVKVRRQTTRLTSLEDRVLASQAELFARQIHELEEGIRKLVRNHEALLISETRLQTIPGIGEITAWTLMAEVRDFSRFDSAKQVAAYAGVCPAIRQSGTSLKGKGTLSRAGNPHARKSLYMAALAAIRSPNPFQQLFQRLLAKGKARKTAIVAVMHKLIRVAYGVLKSGSPFTAERALTPI